MNDTIPMPERIARRPREARGYPVPFVNHVYANGTPDLRILDQRKVNRCVEERRCAICGEKLDETVVFVGGPACLDNRFFADPAMHADCADYATKVCPFLACQNFHHSRITEPKFRDPGTIVIENPLAPPAGDKRPDRMMKYHTTGFKWHIARGGTRLIRAYAPIRIEWF